MKNALILVPLVFSGRYLVEMYLSMCYFGGVSLGCQSKALKLAQSQGMAIPEYLIGLICAGQNSRDMITDLSQLAKIPPHEQLRTLRFKYSHPAYGGWPGNTLMVTDRYRYTLDKRFRLKLKSLYESYRCLLC